MKLSPKQIEFVNAERRHYKDLIAAKEAQKVYAGIDYDRMQLQILQMIIALHNLEVKEKENEQRDSVSSENPDCSFVLSFGC